MQTKTRLLLILAFVSLALVSVGYFYTLGSDVVSSPVPGPVRDSAKPAQTRDIISTPLYSAAQESEPQASTEAESSEDQSVIAEAKSLLEFSPEAIVEALDEVRLDVNGNLIVDHQAYLALRRVLGNNRLAMDALSLSVLQELIQYAMPGDAGSQVAHIAGNYYQYVKARTEFNELHKENYVNLDFAARQKELKRLRSTYLGEEISVQLFGQSDAQNLYLYERFNIESETQLSPLERDRRLTQSQEKYTSSILDVYGWRSSYQEFTKEKDRLVKQDLSAEQKRLQVEQAFARYFDEHERDMMDQLQIPIFN